MVLHNCSYLPILYLRLASFDALSVMVGVLAECAALSAACFVLVLPFLLDCAIT